MTAYLKYRLEKSGITHLERVCICQTDQAWVSQDILDEIQALFPKAKIPSSGNTKQVSCELAIVPYVNPAWTLTQRWAALREVLPSRPEHIGFYELNKRHLIIVRRRELPVYLLRVLVRRLLSSVARTALRWARKALEVFRRIGQPR